VKKKNKRIKICGLLSAIAWLVLFAAGLALIYSGFGLLGSSARDFSDTVHVAENMTFPGNETKLAMGLGFFNFNMGMVGLTLFLGFGIVVVAIQQIMIHLGEFWRVHKNRPTLEERVNLLEIQASTFGPAVWRKPEEKREK
jgi:TRAP-type C4-dicarboxylate transport system permease small subunit